MTKIQVSVVIPSYNSSETIEKCLTSLTQQDNREFFEIIVVDSSNDQTSTIIKQKFPDIKLYTFTERKYAGVARNFGVSQSIGDIIAFIDSDCFVESNWINQVIEIHQKIAQPLIGGAIDNGNPENYLGWAYYFSSFNRWLPASKEEQKTDLATVCLTVKKWVFAKFGGFSEDRFCEDTLFSWKISQGGYTFEEVHQEPGFLKKPGFSTLYCTSESLYTPLFIPEIKVYHINPNSWEKLLVQKVTHGKSFAKLRVEKYQFSQLKLMIYILGSFLLPFLLLYRCFKNVAKANIYMREFMLSLPLVFLGLIAWSYGEFLGYLESIMKFKR